MQTEILPYPNSFSKSQKSDVHPWFADLLRRPKPCAIHSAPLMSVVDTGTAQLRAIDWSPPPVGSERVNGTRFPDRHPGWLDKTFGSRRPVLEHAYARLQESVEPKSRPSMLSAACFFWSTSALRVSVERCPSVRCRSNGDARRLRGDVSADGVSLSLACAPMAPLGPCGRGHAPMTSLREMRSRRAGAAVFRLDRGARTRAAAELGCRLVVRRDRLSRHGRVARPP